MPLSKTSQNSATVQDSISSLLSEETIRTALHRLLSDSRFKTSERNRHFLKFVVEEMLAGRSDKIKSYSIAVDVFGRNQSFDAATDPIVRIEATRLRSALAAYYSGPGQHERVRIDLPKGGYVPSFVLIDVPTPSTTADPNAMPEVRNRTPAVILIITLALLLVGIVLVAGLNESWLNRLWKVNGSLVLLEPTIPMRDDPEETQRARGLGQSIVTALTRFHGLQVIELDRPEQRSEVIRTYQNEPAQI
jgi:hypothetical protein